MRFRVTRRPLQMMNALGRTAVIVNLDPGNENVPYQAAVDIRELVSVPVVMEEMGLGINGALVCGPLCCPVFFCCCLALQPSRVLNLSALGVHFTPHDVCSPGIAWNTLWPTWTGYRTD